MSDTMTGTAHGSADPPPPPPPTPSPPGGGDWNPSSIFGGFRRSDDDRWIAGLAGGIARRWGIDTWVIRLGLVAAAFVGVGVALYVVGWLLLPTDSRASYAQRHAWSRNTSIAVGVIVVLVLGGFAWFDGNGPGWMIPGLLIGVGIVLLLRDRPLGDPARADAVAAPAGPSGTVPRPPVPARPEPAATPPRPRRRPFLTPLTLLALVGFIGVAAALGDATWNEPGVIAAVCVATMGAVLILATWVGRARGLIVAGVLVLPPLLLGVAVDGSWRDWSSDRTVRPSSVTQLDANYEWGFGHRILDLRGLDAPLERTTELSVDQIAGELEVWLPPDTVVDLRAEVGAGEIHLDDEGSAPGARREGLGIELDRRIRHGDGARRLQLDLQLGAGNLDLHQATAPREGN